LQIAEHIRSVSTYLLEDNECSDLEEALTNGYWACRAVRLSCGDETALE